MNIILKNKWWQGKKTKHNDGDKCTHTSKNKYHYVRIPYLILISQVFVACQPGPTKPTVVDQGVLRDGVLGVKAKIDLKNNICKNPVKINKTRYGRLSTRSRRRQQYDYATEIKRKVHSNWLKPKGLTSRSRCTVLIKQRIDGCVVNVSFKRCNSSSMRTTVRQAVLKSSPLPVAPHPALFAAELLLSFK
ncbi:hypothetical protein MNBD_GAMMA12-2861 [hydrothermal vent metagenome]|uniref:TonB C-terminal domain-containing protein n=1 Tax=hydrothermal vent metagenome TaxID=652676 RepID=A0A3B0YWX9_9ZZZZ